MMPGRMTGRARCCARRRASLGVRRFAQARRRARESSLLPAMDASPASSAGNPDDLAVFLAGMEVARQAITLLFGQALAQTTDPDMLERGRCIALNSADAVA